MMGIRKTIKLVTFNPFKSTRLERAKLVRKIQTHNIDLSKVMLEGVYILHIQHKDGSQWLKLGKTGKASLPKRLESIEREFNSRNGYKVTPLYWSVNYGLFWERHTCFIFEQRSLEYLREVEGLENDTSFGMYRKELFKLTKEQSKAKTRIVSDVKEYIHDLWFNPEAKNVGHFGRLTK